MMKRKTSRNNSFADTLNRVSVNKEVPKSVFVLLLLLYLIANHFTRSFSQSQEILFINGKALPLTMLAGVTASLGNICIILIVILFGKLGFITTLILMVAQFPRLMMSIIVGQNYVAVQGIFTGLLTIVASVIIFLNHLRMIK